MTHLRASGKVSADDVENIFKNHVLTDPDLPQRIAAEVSTDDWVGIVGKVVAAGHGRTAAKLRSYARAAYELAIRSKTDPAAPQWLKEFGIKFNPLATISALAQYNKALDRNLSAPEFAAFLGRVHAAPIDAKRDALEVCIYTGGQRPTQLSFFGPKLLSSHRDREYGDGRENLTNKRVAGPMPASKR